MAEQRRIPLWAKALIATVVIVTVAFYVGGGLVFSNMIHADALTPEPPTPDNVVWVREIEGNEIVITSEEEVMTRPAMGCTAWPGVQATGRSERFSPPRVSRSGEPSTCWTGARHRCAPATSTLASRLISKAGPIQTTRLRPVSSPGRSHSTAPSVRWAPGWSTAVRSRYGRFMSTVGGHPGARRCVPWPPITDSESRRS